MSFPTNLDNLTSTRGTGTDTLAAVNHVTHHTNEDTAIEALEAKVGIDGSAVTTSHDYKLSEVTSTDKAVGKTAQQTLSGKTLSDPKILLGSDAKGDMLQISNSSTGALARLRASNNNDIISWNSSTQQWEAIPNPAATDASNSAKGVVEIATTGEISAGTSTGGTGATLVVPASAVGAAGADKLVQYDNAGKYPAADGSAITNLTVRSTSGVASNPGTSGTATITHGLGRTPSIIRVHAIGTLVSSTSASVYSTSYGTYNATGNRCTYIAAPTVGQGAFPATSTSYAVYLDIGNGGASATGVIQTVGATTFEIAWTDTTGTANGKIIWEAQ